MEVLSKSFFFQTGKWKSLLASIYVKYRATIFISTTASILQGETHSVKTYVISAVEVVHCFLCLIKKTKPTHSPEYRRCIGIVLLSSSAPQDIHQGRACRTLMGQVPSPRQAYILLQSLQSSLKNSTKINTLHHFLILIFDPYPPLQMSLSAAAWKKKYKQQSLI